ncbi:TetR/AcrR family transcriptional regulator C-terminal domain-containing protein [Streptomyces sp. AV19]|uniref:TetR/AcrR family transcriptional regulator C-terminal domain-containing protein n=1 Tax=Streptomyces sp. AV19 TaxID=2793068 RepID=UPI0018FE341C|nr:TetR/AcrR family transcriptional regulator C-terminal domain-containing protein [Streptomyces sp. AV19]MBH1935896.1 TetR/AcrR family transcriptional regulator C-terminal domain-containing protein [Streptomyces sp. AV19]MDG4534321.1 TetR/AcrR family transcriptional regulator C-terminal domain-containing protein [Streptomyces sp. AV19]
MATRLDREQVVDTALGLLNEVGLEGLTLRRIGQELDVRAPALYWHFKDKQDLLDAMATEMLRRMSRAERLREVTEQPAWQDVLAESHRALRRTLLSYRDGAKVYSGTRFTDNSYADTMEGYLASLVEAGFAPRTAARAFYTAYCYTIGYVIEEQSAVGYPDQGVKGIDLMEREQRLHDYPIAAAAGPELFGESEAGFEAGLRAVIAGLEATLPKG